MAQKIGSVEIDGERVIVVGGGRGPNLPCYFCGYETLTAGGKIALVPPMLVIAGSTLAEAERAAALTSKARLF